MSALSSITVAFDIARLLMMQPRTVTELFEATGLAKRDTVGKHLESARMAGLVYVSKWIRCNGGRGMWIAVYAWQREPFAAENAVHPYQLSPDDLRQLEAQQHGEASCVT